MSEREAFLRALAENEDDTTTRLVYADWLDERGEHEEADRQRKWPAAKAWLVRFCRDHNPLPGAPDGRVISYEELIAMGREAVERVLASRGYESRYGGPERMLENGWQLLLDAGLIDGPEGWRFEFSFGPNEDMAYGFGAAVREFWANWSVVTGIPLPPGVEEKTSYRCSC